MIFTIIYCPCFGAVVEAPVHPPPKNLPFLIILIEL